MSTPDPDLDYPIPDGHAPWLGRLIAVSGAIGFHLEMLTWHLLGLEPLGGRVVTSPLEMRSKLETIRKLLAVRKISDEARDK